jgi:hypothetical protein
VLIAPLLIQIRRAGVQKKIRGAAREYRAPTRNSDVSQGQHALNPSSHGMTPEPNPAQAIVASKIAGGVTASLPFYRPHSEEKASAARKRPTKRLRAATKGGRGEK